MNGYFITFEGIDGCGKTTQSRLLTDFLKRRGKRVVHTRQPGGTSFGAHIRDVFLHGNRRLDGVTELFLMAADRAEHVGSVIGPKLGTGHYVVCERYTDSTEAYQGYGRGIPLKKVREVNAIATGHLRPDVTILLDLPPESALERRSPSPDRIESETGGFFEKIRRGYLRLADEYPDRIVSVNALETEEKVHRTIVGILADRGIIT